MRTSRLLASLALVLLIAWLWPIHAQVVVTNASAVNALGTSSLSLKLPATASYRVAMASPGAITPTPGAAGTLNNGSYYFKLVAVDLQGNTTDAGAEATCTTVAGAGAGSCSLAFSTVTGAVSYRIYGWQTGAQTGYKVATSSPFVWVDHTTNFVAGSVPTTNSAYRLCIGGACGTTNWLGLPLAFPAGTPAAPSLAFASAPTTGRSWDSANGTAIVESLVGVRIAYWQFSPAVGTSAAGQGSTFLGYKAGLLNYSTSTDAYNNTFIGAQSGPANTTGHQNTFIGSSSGAKNTTGITNTYIGQGAGYSNVTTSANTSVGWHALLNPLGERNTAVGASAGQGATGAGTTAAFNALFGYNAGIAITSAQESTGLGYNALQALTTGSETVAVGAGAGFSDATGTGNVYVGRRAGYTATAGNANVSGSYNVWIGHQAGPGTASQLSNAIAVGSGALNSASNQVVLGNDAVTVWSLGLPTGNTTSGTTQWTHVPATINMATATGTGTGTITVANFFPAGCVAEGLSGRVTTILAGAALTTWSIGPTSDTDRYGTTLALAANTLVNPTTYTIATTGQIHAAAENLVITAAAGVFSTGVLKVTLTCKNLTPIGS